MIGKKGNTFNAIDFMDIYFANAKLVNQAVFTEYFLKNCETPVIEFSAIMHELLIGYMDKQALSVNTSFFAASVFYRLYSGKMSSNLIHKHNLLI